MTRGRIAGRLPTTVSSFTSTRNALPMIERLVSTSPFRTSPRACIVARFADDPVPQGERSTRPGFSTVQVRTTPSSPMSRNIT